MTALTAVSRCSFPTLIRRCRHPVTSTFPCRRRRRHASPPALPALPGVPFPTLVPPLPASSDDRPSMPPTPPAMPSPPALPACQAFRFRRWFAAASYSVTIDIPCADAAGVPETAHCRLVHRLRLAMPWTATLCKPRSRPPQRQLSARQGRRMGHSTGRRRDGGRDRRCRARVNERGAGRRRDSSATRQCRHRPARKPATC